MLPVTALSVHNKDLTCLGHLLFRRGQDFIDDRDLCRMDCAFAMKAKASATLAVSISAMIFVDLSASRSRLQIERIVAEESHFGITTDR
jgi:hypothetical protein